jgi:hypothetical protein
MKALNQNQILFNYRDGNTNEIIPNITSVISIRIAAFTEGKLNFTSDVIGEIKSTTDGDGNMIVDLFKLLNITFLCL